MLRLYGNRCRNILRLGYSIRWLACFLLMLQRHSYPEHECYYSRSCTPFQDCRPIRNVWLLLILPDASEQDGELTPLSRNIAVGAEIVRKKHLLFPRCLGSHIAVEQFLYVFSFHHLVILLISCNNRCRAFDIMPRHDDSLAPSTWAISAKLIFSRSRISTILLQL